MPGRRPEMRVPGRRGLTLVEMLVVVAIIGVLVALLLPAVQSARESSRATACRNNVRQFALALLVHADAKKQFPRGLVCTTGTCDLTGSFDGRYSARSTDWGESFTIRILPFLEYQSIYDAYQFDQPNSLLANNKAVVPWLSTLLCPGRDRGVLYMKDANPNRQYVSRVQYGGNFGAGYAISETLSWQQGLRGIFNGAKQWGAAIKDVTDGLSKTLLVGETTIDPDANSDSRGAWNLDGLHRRARSGGPDHGRHRGGHAGAQQHPVGHHRWGEHGGQRDLLSEHEGHGQPGVLLRRRQPRRGGPQHASRRRERGLRRRERAVHHRRDRSGHLVPAAHDPGRGDDRRLLSGDVFSVTSAR